MLRDKIDKILEQNLGVADDTNFEWMKDQLLALFNSNLKEERHEDKEQIKNLRMEVSYWKQKV
jgi:hypothetical protein